MSKKKHKIKITSLLSYADVLENLGDRQTEVYRTILKLRSCNSTMISQHLKLPINCVVPRVNELRKYSIVMEDKKARCPYTKKLTIFWRVRRRI